MTLGSRKSGPATPEDSTAEGTVRGERGRPFVSTTRSLHSRVSSIMACGLMIILGAGMLTWYYSNAFSKQSRARQSAQTATLRRAQGEMPLPALDGFSSVRTSVSPTVQATTEPPQSPELPLTPLKSNGDAVGTYSGPYGRVAQKSAEQIALERVLAGAAFAREAGDRVITHQAASTRSEDAAAETQWPAGDIGPLLQPTAIASARAHVLPTRRFLLPKGAFIDCTLETALDSTLPGMTTCITATDTFSADGTVVLLERGTKLIGETRGQVNQGVARVFVLWTEARTPVGIAVPLDSPGTDELGRSGQTGQVNRHFWERFGAAILISTLDGAVQAAAQSAGRGGGAVIYNPSSSAGVATDVLKSSVNIPPTVTQRNGDRIQVLVARDVDFRSVYELRFSATAP